MAYLRSGVSFGQSELLGEVFVVESINCETSFLQGFQGCNDPMLTIPIDISSSNLDHFEHLV